MVSRIGRGTCAILIASILVAKGNSAAPNMTDWAPPPMNEIRAIYNNRSLSDDEAVDRLVEQLDERITVYRNYSRNHPNETEPGHRGHEYAVLLRLIAERPYPAKPRGRPEAIHKVIASLSADSHFENKDALRSLLFLGLGLAGEFHEREVMTFVEDRTMPNELVLVALQAMERTNVPLRALPHLLELAESPLSHIEDASGGDVGPRHPKREFPLREAAFRCLKKLNIKVEKAEVEEPKAGVYGVRLTTTTIIIDRPALVDRLRKGLRSDDFKTKSDSLDAAQRIGGDDMRQLLKDESKPRK